jgi:hypothetical protein
MRYKKIIAELGTDGEGVREFNQTVESASRTGYGSFGASYVFGEGICRGLVTEWLRCKKSGTAFAPESTDSLLAKHKTISSGFIEQSAYVDIGDTMTDQSLHNAGLELVKGEALESQYIGFAENAPSIAQRVLTSGSRYFILSLLGHSLGVHREWAFFGKSSTVFIYDPNIGEFKVTGEEGIKKVLKAIRKHAYSGSYLKGYKLRAYKG